MPVAINTGLSGIPFWGTDIGGFVPTPEYTGELHVRWFQFGAFCPLFRAHGRTWHLRLPWGWNTGEVGPSETRGYTGGAGEPDVSELHNAAVEPIVKQYLELRYRMLPYMYSIARECCETGLPMMRALWLHYPDDPQAVLRGDQYLWGRDVLVSPVVEKARPRGVCISRAETGSISGPKSAWPAGGRLIALSIWQPCRCTCVRARCCHLGQSNSTATKRSSNRSPSSCIQVRMGHSRSTRTTGGRSTTGAVNGWGSRCDGRMRRSA